MNPIGYGVITRNEPVTNIRSTIAFQELENIGYSDKTVFDIVRSDDPLRPKLDLLLDSLTENDCLHIYSIHTLFYGDNSQAVAYYEKMLNARCGVVIYDFSGAVFKLSPYSTADFGGEKNISEDEKEKRLNAFARYYEEEKDHSFKRRGEHKGKARSDISEAFKEIYFAYESYQISLEEALDLLRDYCGIEHKVTFWAMAEDFQKTYDYATELDMYATTVPAILDMPKRTGGVPEEYFQIKDYPQEPFWQFLDEEEKIQMAINGLNMIANFAVYRRWDNLFLKIPRPRKRQYFGFDVDEFKEKYTRYKTIYM